MSIETEIARLEKAKRLMKFQIKKQGVHVPDDARLDQYASYISMIGRKTVSETPGGDVK